MNNNILEDPRFWDYSKETKKTRAEFRKSLVNMKKKEPKNTADYPELFKTLHASVQVEISHMTPDEIPWVCTSTE